MTREEIKIVKKGGIGVIPTDTIYGLVGKALDRKAVERIYGVKGRSPEKPLIILIADMSHLALFNINLSPELEKSLLSYWPGPVSVILPLKKGNHFEYLHRGTNTLAFRLPKDSELRLFLQETGPLVAPSANPEGKIPARTIEEARAYFGDTVDFYHDGGFKTGSPSRLVSFEGGEEKVLRG